MTPLDDQALYVLKQLYREGCLCRLEDGYLSIYGTPSVKTMALASMAAAQIIDLMGRYPAIEQSLVLGFTMGHQGMAPAIDRLLAEAMGAVSRGEAATPKHPETPPLTPDQRRRVYTLVGQPLPEDLR